MSVRSNRIREIMKERSCCFNTAAYYYDIEIGKKTPKKRIYSELTKEELIEHGIINVTEDGHIFSNKGEIKQYWGTYAVVCTGCKVYYVHRVVYVWFNDIQPADKVVDHIDGNKANNNLNNLQLISRSENIKRRFLNRDESKVIVGKNQYTQGLTDEEIFDIRLKKQQKQEAVNQRKEARAAKKQSNKEKSIKAKNRADKIKEFQKEIDRTRLINRQDRTVESWNAWKQAVANKNEWIKNNPKEHKKH